MNNLEIIAKHLQEMRPLMESLAGSKRSIDEQSIDRLHSKAVRESRLPEVVEIANFIGIASLMECKLIINELIERVSSLTGIACELENASCMLSKEIAGDCYDEN